MNLKNKVQSYIDSTQTTIECLLAERNKISRYDIESEAKQAQRATHRAHLVILEDIKSALDNGYL